MKYTVPQRPRQVDDNSGVSEKIAYTLNLYDYLWNINRFDEATLVVETFFRRIFEANFRFDE